MPAQTKTYLEQAIEDGQAKIAGEGKTQRIHYVAAGHSERWSDPEEKVRAEFWAELIYKYQYRPGRMRFEVKVPRRTPNDLADIVIYGDKDDELKSPWFVFECKRADVSDAVLLAGLKERMEVIEAMRNCCAHSRRPSKKVIENYDNVRPLLDQLLDGYLTRWEWQEPVEEMFWERKAREAVEDAIERAQWDEDERTITLFDVDDDRMRQTVTSRDELQQYLCDVARTEFYANAPREDGEFLDECDDDGIVWACLAQYEQRLGEFFGAEGGADA